VGHAVGQGIAPAGGARLEDRARDVPLEEMNGAAPGPGEMGELVEQEALPRAREPGEEDDAKGAELGERRAEPWIRIDDDVQG